MKPSENPLGSEPVSSLLRRFAIPSVIAMLVSALYNMVDQLFIGHSIGVLGNAATNVAFPLSMVCTSIGLLCGIGVGLLISVIFGLMAFVFKASAVLQISISAWAERIRSTRNPMLEMPSPCWQSSV